MNNYIHNTIKIITEYIKEIKQNPLSFSERRLFNQLQDYKVTYSANKNYKEHVKNNQNDSLTTIKKKLIRNIVLGRKISTENFVNAYQYGNLVIWVDTYKKEIFKLYNFKGNYVYDVDENKKEWLNNTYVCENDKKAIKSEKTEKISQMVKYDNLESLDIQGL